MAVFEGPPLREYAELSGTNFLALRGFAPRGAGEADPPPVDLRLLPSETYRPRVLLGMRLLRR